MIEGVDNRLWFATSRAVFSLDPQHLVRIHNSVAPPVVIDALARLRKVLPRGAGSAVAQSDDGAANPLRRFEPDHARKGSLSLQARGVNQDWQDAQEREVAYFTNLSPGRYHFQVIAANNDGVWNEKGATLDFLIPPMFTQTAWFLVLCIGCSGALIWLLFQLRLRQLAARMRLLLDERLRERERIGAGITRHSAAEHAGPHVARAGRYKPHDAGRPDSGGARWRVEACG